MPTKTDADKDPGLTDNGATLFYIASQKMAENPEGRFVFLTFWDVV